METSKAKYQVIEALIYKAEGSLHRNIIDWLGVVLFCIFTEMFITGFTSFNILTPDNILSHFLLYLCILGAFSVLSLGVFVPIKQFMVKMEFIDSIKILGVISIPVFLAGWYLLRSVRESE